MLENGNFNISPVPHMNINLLLFSVLLKSLTGVMLTSTGIGMVFGLMVFVLWWFTEWTRLCLLFDALFLGFLVGATLMFTPFGE